MNKIGLLLTLSFISLLVYVFTVSPYINTKFEEVNFHFSCTAFPISPNGYIATAGHCTPDNSSIYIRIDGQLLLATKVLKDTSTDIGILHVNHHFNKWFSVTNHVVVGETTHILGYPLAQNIHWPLHINTGVYEGMGWDRMSVSGGSCEGNSGGPTVDSSNHVIGILVQGYGKPCSDTGLLTSGSNLIYEMNRVGIPYTLGESNNQYSPNDIFNMDLDSVFLLIF